MDSKAISSLIYVTIGWVVCGNPSCTYLKDMQTRIAKEIVKVA